MGHLSKSPIGRRLQSTSIAFLMHVGFILRHRCLCFTQQLIIRPIQFISHHIYTILGQQINMDKKQHPRFSRGYLQKAFDLILDFTEQTLQGNNKVIDLKLPTSLSQEIDFKIANEPMSEEELLSVCSKILDYSVKPYHPHFHNTLFGGFDQYAVSGAMFIPFINGNMYTYELASAFTLMEKEIYEHFGRVLEWQSTDGLMAPGGSFGNILAIQVARYHAFPEVKEKGIQHLPPLKIMVSDVCHYSLKKGANLAGLGTNSLVQVKTDEVGRMIPEQLDRALEEEVKKGNKPFMVCSTIGTTVEGAIDDVGAIAAVCHKHKVWYHLDAAFGGVFFASPTLRHKIGCCKLVDSVVWDPHKGLCVPLQACVFLVRHKGLMEECNSTVADYLFHKERKNYDASLDTGNKTVQCGRVIDVLKLWIYFKGNGWNGIDDQVKRQQALTIYTRQYVQKAQNFKLAMPEPETFNVCFWCIPKELKRENCGSEQEYMQILNDVTVLAKKFMIDEGLMLMGYSSSKGSKYFWRTVMSNPYISEKDVDYEMELTVKYCEMAYKEITNKI